VHIQPYTPRIVSQLRLWAPLDFAYDFLSIAASSTVCIAPYPAMRTPLSSSGSDMAIGPDWILVEENPVGEDTD
jgi:hypothetical protein